MIIESKSLKELHSDLRELQRMYDRVNDRANYWEGVTQDLEQECDDLEEWITDVQDYIENLDTGYYP